MKSLLWYSWYFLKDRDRIIIVSARLYFCIKSDKLEMCFSRRRSFQQTNAQIRLFYFCPRVFVPFLEKSEDTKKYSIVKDSSADLGVNSKIVQIRPSQ